MSDIYPLVVVLDRYNGTYSGGKWTAWNMDYSDIPKKVSGDDIECSEFFAIHHLIYGRGETPKEAIDDLKCMLQRGSHMPKEHIKAVSGSTEDEEDDEMKATSVQRIENVNDICFSIENHPIERESKLTIVASTNDDVFAFELEGPDLLPNCKKVGLFTGWEKDQKIKELEKENKDLKAKSKEISDDNALLLETNKELKQENDDRTVSAIAAKERNRMLEIENEKLKKENEKLKKSYDILDLDKALNRSQEHCSKWYEKWVKMQSEQDSHICTREGILDQAKKCVCGQREQDYGTPESNFKIIANLWNDYLGLAENGDGVPIFSIKNITPTDVSMMMALLKIARIKNGGGSGDSFVDLAGYAACGGEIWVEKKSQKDQN